MKIIISLIISALLINFSGNLDLTHVLNSQKILSIFFFYKEGCDLLKFSHKNSKPDFYKRLRNKECNGEPIFKMLDDDFFLYKLPNSKYWCDSYTPSKLVVCHAECDEIRFDISTLYEATGAIAHEYNSHIEEWESMTGEILTCNDNRDFDNVLTIAGSVDNSKEKIQEIKGII